MVVMANSTQLQVLSLNEFLHLPPTTKVVTRPLPYKQTRKPTKKRSAVVAEPITLKRSLDYQVEMKKTKKSSLKNKQGTSFTPQWSYDVDTSTTSLVPSKKRKEMPSLVVCTPKKRKDTVEVVVEKANCKSTLDPVVVKAPSVVEVTLPGHTVQVQAESPISPEKNPRRASVESIVVDTNLYRTPEPKKVNVREVLSPVVSISPSSSPCTTHTPQQPSSPPAKEWSPFVIPKKTKAPAFVLDVPPPVISVTQPCPTQPQVEEAIAVSTIASGTPAAEVESAQERTNACDETPCMVSKVPRKLDINEADFLSAKEPSDFHDGTATLNKFGGGHGLALLMQVSCLQVDEIEAMDPVHRLTDPDIAQATSDRFQAERTALLTKFQRAHHDLIRRVCTQLHHQQSAVDRMDPVTVRQQFRVEVRDLIGLQQLEADALCASQFMQWTVLGLGGFDMPRLVPMFPAPRLFG
ncbi:hypothetical protein DYB32_002102 [Aphanomyces invadans]|uniref:Uncharacterized protein n=1 Tax=Aphanomyces invadans TaxID=157072 RepID=A0A3R7D4K2_9STRA|nr:hypothetical protein DYB32_002102 [Aphanomyces invadans]